MRKIIVFIVFVVFAYFVFQFGILKSQEDQFDVYHYVDGFDSLDRDYWFVGEWETHKSAFSKVFLEDGVLTIPVKETDRGPYVLSEPILVGDREILKIKRRVKVHYGSDYFAGGLVIFETDDNTFRPDPNVGLPFGNALILVEYAHDVQEGTERPGRDNFRLLAPDWKLNKNYVLAEPIYDEWFIEELTYNTYTGRVTYEINDKAYTLRSLALTKDYIRIWMHAYGSFTGHQVQVDYMDITLTYPEVEAIEAEKLKKDEAKESDESN